MRNIFSQKQLELSFGKHCQQIDQVEAGCQGGHFGYVARCACLRIAVRSLKRTEAATEEPSGASGTGASNLKKVRVETGSHFI